MDINSVEHRGREGFDADQPLEMLKKDHEFVRKLFDHYLHTQDMNVRREAGSRILSLLEMHMALEETVFYPRVRSADPALIDESEDEHHQAKQLMDQLKGMNPDDPQCTQMFQQLSDAIMRHVEKEEQQLFPKVQQANLDLNAIGLEMQAYDANVVSALAQASDRTGMRP